jgi:hypothetical protein
MQLSCTVVQMWESPELVPHEVSGRVYLRINFKLHIYFAVRKIICGSMTVPDCLAEVYSADRHPSPRLPVSWIHGHMSFLVRCSLKNSL